MKLHGPTLILITYSFISLSKSYSMKRLIEIERWIDITDDESISFYIPATLSLSLLVPSIMIDE
jgi:hypothetical protein